MSQNKLKQRIFKGLMSGAFGQAVTIGIQLLSIPLLLHYWGIELYGEWLILSAIPTYLSLSNIGLPATAGNAIAMLDENTDQEKRLEIYQSTWFMVTGFSLIMLFIFIAAIYLFNVYELTNIKTMAKETFFIAISLLLFHVILCFQSGILKIAYRAIKRNPFGDFLNYLTRMFEWIGASILVFYGQGIIEVALCFVIVRVLSNIIQWGILKINKNKLSIGVKYYKFSAVKSLLKPSVAAMSFPLGLALVLQGMIILIGHFLSPASVVVFNVYRTLTRVVVQVVAVINQSIWPEISYAYSQGNINLIKSLMKRSQMVCFIIGLVLITALHFTHELIIDLWLNKSIIHNELLFQTLLAATFIHLLWQPFWVTKMALNKHVIFSYFFVLISLLTILISTQLIPLLGIIGVGYSMALGEALLLCSSYYLIKKTIRAL